MKRTVLLALAVVGILSLGGCSWLCCDPCKDKCCTIYDPCATPGTPSAPLPQK